MFNFESLPETYQQLLEYQIFQVSVFKIILALVLLFVLIIVFKLFQKIILHKLQKFSTQAETAISKELVKTIQNISPLVYYTLALYLPLRFLISNESYLSIIETIVLAVVLYEGIKIIQQIISFILKRTVSKSKNEQQVKTMSNGVRLIVSVSLWSIAVLLVLSNLGFNITSLIASLGIGGIALAFAAQNILGDLLSSFSIYFDRPFEIGDYIVIGKDMGTVKKIGLKSTRIVSLQGEELIISNQELCKVRIQNFKKMKKRRTSFQLGLTCNTTVDQIHKAKKIITEIIEQIETVEFSRVHFFEFGSSSLNLEVVYSVHSGDFTEHMDIREQINLQIKSKFAEEKIMMAFPTQTIQIEKV